MHHANNVFGGGGVGRSLVTNSAGNWKPEESDYGLALAMAVSPADKGHSPFPSSERAIYGFALYLASYVFISELLMNWALPEIKHL